MSLPLIEFLDKPDCRAHLMKISDDAVKQLPRHLQLSNMSDMKFLRENYVAHKAVDGSAKVVLRNSDLDAEMEEAVWEGQGVLLDYDLPPILDRNSLPTKIIWAKQSVRLLGIGSPLFDQSVAGVAAIHRLIDSIYSVKGLRPWVPDQVESHASLSFANRYVTPLSLVNGSSPVPFGDVVDPQGLLLLATSTAGAHLDDNKVEYYERKWNSTSSDYHYITIDPAIIRPGQIVQVQVSFVTVPLSGKKGLYQMACKLRSVAILDRQLQEAYDMQAYSIEFQKKASPPKVLKRRIGYVVSVDAMSREVKKTKSTVVEGLEDTFMQDSSSA